jgi:hypothetical protein
VLLYSELAHWWPLFSPPSHYVEEAEHLLGMLRPLPGRKLSLLELGAGGGSLAYHLKPHFELTLTDRSPEMLRVCQEVHPEAELIVGDLRSLDLERQFDRVLLHDAVMYLTTEDELRSALLTCRRHCRDDGLVLVVPDCVTETFEPHTEHGGEDAPDGRGFRYLEWIWDPDPADTMFEAVFGVLLRDTAGEVEVRSDRHRCGLFPKDTWRRLFSEAGLSVATERDPWRQYVFVGRPIGARGL